MPVPLFSLDFLGITFQKYTKRTVPFVYFAVKVVKVKMVKIDFGNAVIAHYI